MSLQFRPEGRPAAPPDTSSASPPGPGDAAFDRWLKRELGRMFDETLAEPVPDDLLRLVNAAAKDGPRRDEERDRPAAPRR